MRVVHGGSWFNFPSYARSAACINYHPGNRYDYFGFRVLCSSPIE
ncbi:MAG: hypothetical protein HRU78_03955 [Gammaproteobacteria bacterium]|nr:MAG: hypothetical protein HRU78_03955 [Gammaproteobacteria bacterium]